MNSNYIQIHRFILGIIIGSCLTLSQVKGALPEGMEETLELRIDSELEKVLLELVTEKQVCEELWLPWPIEPPEKEISEMEEEIHDLVQKKSEAMFPITAEEDYEKEAIAKYKLFEMGEFVRVKLKDGSEVTGYLREKGGTELLIDNRTIKLTDIDKKELAHFDDIVREVRIKEYVRSRLAELKENRLDYEQKIHNEVSEQLYTDFGYIKVKGNWIAKKEFVNNRMNDHKEKLKEKLKPLLRTKVYYDSGFVFFDNEWIPNQEAKDRHQQRLKEEAKKTENLELELLEEEKEEEGKEDDQESLWD